MELSRKQIKRAGVKYIALACALGIKPQSLSYFGEDEPLPPQHQYALRFGSKEAQAIRRKTLRYIKKNEGK